jgi:hypothetical protein
VVGVDTVNSRRGARWIQEVGEFKEDKQGEPLFVWEAVGASKRKSATDLERESRSKGGQNEPKATTGGGRHSCQGAK